SLYTSLFASHAPQGVAVAPSVAKHNECAWAQYTIRVNRRDEVVSNLRSAGVPTAVHYPLPLNQQPAVADSSFCVPLGELASQQVLSLPMHPYLAESAVAHV